MDKDHSKDKNYFSTLNIDKNYSSFTDLDKVLFKDSKDSKKMIIDIVEKYDQTNKSFETFQKKWKRCLHQFIADKIFLIIGIIMIYVLLTIFSSIILSYLICRK